MRFGALIVGLFLSITSLAQKHEFKVTIKGAADSAVHLVRYYGDKMYYADTVVADKSGTVNFDKKFLKEPGMYAVMPGKKNGYFEILVNDEDIVLETELGAQRYVPAMKVKKSNENKMFYDYVGFIQEKSAKLQQLQAQLKTAQDDATQESLQAEITKLNKEVVDKQRQIINENPESVIGLLLSTGLEVEVPEAPEGAADNWQRNYYVSNFWKNIDLTNDALTRMPVYHKRLERYFTKILPQQPDSLIEGAKRITSQLQEGSEMYKYTVVWITSHYQKSKIMCMDKVFVHMVLTHYKTGKSFWMTEAKNKEIVDRAEEMAPVTCGEMAHNIVLPDTSQENWIPLYSIDKDYTVLIFWDPDCGHCKKEIPELIKKYKQWQSEGLPVEVYSVSSKNSDEWRKFIVDNGLTWVNVAVPERVYAEDSQEYINEIVLSKKTDLPSLNYHKTFDVFKTPTVYLLDKDKVIVGKSLDHKGIDEVVRKMIEQDQ